MASLPNIPEYYANKSVFLTGATGFIGKVLIEKLLRSCPDIKGIHCLVRTKKGVAAQDRITALCEGRVFDSLRLVDPNFAEKVHAIPGDVLDPGLGISDEDRVFMENNIDIVFHSAATIKFNEPLRFALGMNVVAVRKMVQLCLKFKKLEVFVHVSTAYSNCDRHHIEEVIYPPTVEPQKLLEVTEWISDEMLEVITPKLIGSLPNTYTYTKQLAEHLLIQEGKDLPLAIVRPSIVTAAWREPTPGWIDNLNGPSGLGLAIGKGILRTLLADSQAVADFIPVDLIVNMLAAVAWHTAVMKPENPLIYHMTSGNLNPITWGELCSLTMNLSKNIPLESCFRRPKCHLTSNSWIYEYWVFVCHMIPAYTVDFGFKMLGKKPKMVPIYQKLHKAMKTVNFFSLRSWEWTHTNMDILRKDMSPEDQKIFYFDPSAIQWSTCIQYYYLGVKKYLLNEDDSGLPAARAHIKKLRNMRYMFNTFLLVIFWHVMKYSLAWNFWNFWYLF